MDPMGILNIIKSSTRLSWKKRSSWWCALAPAWKRIQPHGWRKWYLEHVPTDELSTSVVTVCFLSVYYVWITYDYCKIKKTQFAKSWPVYSVQSWNSLSQCEKKTHQMMYHVSISHLFLPRIHTQSGSRRPWIPSSWCWQNRRNQVFTQTKLKMIQFQFISSTYWHISTKFSGSKISRNHFWPHVWHL